MASQNTGNPTTTSLQFNPSPSTSETLAVPIQPTSRKSEVPAPPGVDGGSKSPGADGASNSPGPDGVSKSPGPDALKPTGGSSTVPYQSGPSPSDLTTPKPSNASQPTFISELSSNSTGLTLPPSTTPTSTPGPDPISPGAIAGIVIGVLGALFFLSFLGFFFWRRRRGHKEPVEGHYNTYGTPADGHTTVSHAPALATKKDDGGMLRLYKGVDAKLTDHVLNFYLSPDAETTFYEQQLAGAPKETVRELEGLVGRFKKVVVDEQARVYALRAGLASLVLGKISTGVLFTDRNGGKLSADASGYDTARERAVLRIAADALTRVRPFVTVKVPENVILRNLEVFVRAAAEFARALEDQETEGFSLLWRAPDATGDDVTVFDASCMEVVYSMKSDGTRSPRLRGTVFPGLQKVVRNGEKTESVVLAKIQAMVY